MSIQDPPSFLLPGHQIEYELAKQVHAIAQADEEASITPLVATQPDPKPASETVKKTTPKRTDVFEAEFGSSGFGEGFDFASQPPPTPKKDDRCVLACVCVSITVLIPLFRDSPLEELLKELVDLTTLPSHTHLTLSYLSLPSHTFTTPTIPSHTPPLSPHTLTPPSSHHYLLLPPIT